MTMEDRILASLEEYLDSLEPCMIGEEIAKIELLGNGGISVEEYFSALGNNSGIDILYGYCDTTKVNEGIEFGAWPNYMVANELNPLSISFGLNLVQPSDLESLIVIAGHTQHSLAA